MTKYCIISGLGIEDNKTVLELSDDAANVNWGGKWRMPTRKEKDELSYYCTWEWTTLNGIEGYKVISKKNGNSIFLPAAGYRYDSDLKNAGSNGYYWLSSLNWLGINDAYGLYFDSSFVNWDSYGDRFYGRSVRAVCE